MVDTEIRNLVDGTEYDHLFPKAKGEVIIIKRHAKLEDTIKFLPKALRITKYQTALIAKTLFQEVQKKFESPTLFDFLKYLWDWTYARIHYEKDEKNKEQIQSPQYTWWRKKGDCDDYTVFLVSILLHFKELRTVL